METISCCVKELLPFLPWWQCINIDSFGVIISLQARCSNNSIPCFLKMKTGPNWAYSLNYIVQVGNPWTNLAECGQLTARYSALVVILKTMCTNFDFFFSFLRCIFSTGNANDLLFLTLSTYNKRKSETLLTFPRALHTSYLATLFPFLVPNTTRSSKEDLIYFNLF